MSLAIEPMREANLAAVLAIEREVAVVPWTAGHFADSLKAGYSAWVGRRNGEIVGFALWMLTYAEAHLLNLGVSHAWQGRGYGELLLRHVTAGARRAGAESLFLEVRPSNAGALRLYRRLGFSEVGRRKGYYPAPLPQAREDALVLRLALDEDPECDVKN